jgi:hypothetical protein
MDTTLALQSMPVKTDKTSETTSDVTDSLNIPTGISAGIPAAMRVAGTTATTTPSRPTTPSDEGSNRSHSGRTAGPIQAVDGLIRIGHIFARWVAEHAPDETCDDLLALFTSEVLEGAGVSHQ